MRDNKRGRNFGGGNEKITNKIKWKYDEQEEVNSIKKLII